MDTSTVPQPLAEPPASDTITRRLLDEFQRGFPLTARPFAAIADELGLDEHEVITMLNDLRTSGTVTRVGAVVSPARIGASTLAAMAVPPERLDDVAQIVSARAEVNHNYEREHTFNLWFVAVAPDAGQLQRVLDEIAAETGLEVLDLPLVEPYHIDLGFPLSWS